MTTSLDASRRSFLVGSAAGLGGLMLGFHVPFAREPSRRPTPRRRSTPGWWSSPTTRW